MFFSTALRSRLYNESTVSEALSGKALPVKTTPSLKMVSLKKARFCNTTFLRALLICLLFIVIQCVGASPVFTNPTVQQGSSATFTLMGHDSPNTPSWDIVHGGLVATSMMTNGWGVAPNSMTNTVTVFAPIFAAVGSNYEVRITPGYSVVFDVVAPQPPTISSLTLSPTSVTGGNSSTGTVTLSGNAASGVALVALASNSSTASVPANVTVPAGQNNITFTVTTQTVFTGTTALMTASYAGSSATATLTITPFTGPYQIASVTMSPPSVAGGSPSTGTVSLNGPAPIGGLSVTLASSDTSIATVPATAVIAAGQKSATFTVTTLSVTSTHNVAISTAYNSSTQSANLTVGQQSIANIAASYNSGTPQSAALTVNPSTGSAGMALTAAGISEGFQLTTFATGFPTTSDGKLGPFGMAYTSNKHLYAVDFANHYLYDFPTDTDGQSAGSVASYNTQAGVGLTNDRGVIYMTTGSGVVSVAIVGGALQMTTIVSNLNNDFGIAANPANGHLFVTSQGNSCLYDVDPIAKTATVFLSGLTLPDGVWVAPDGSVVYFTSNEHVYGYAIATNTLVFDSGKMDGPDGVAIGTGMLQNKLYVNTNSGQVWEFDLATANATLIASGGSRGDFATPSPNGSLLVTQSDRILRLTPSSPGSFESAGKIIVTRDDLTNPNTINYSPFNLVAPQTLGSASPNASFNAYGLGGTVTRAFMQRGGQLAWSNATHFDAMLGISSLLSNGPSDVGILISNAQLQGSGWNYAMYWELGQPFCADITAGLGQDYQLALTDQISAAAGNYTITDTPQYNWPTLSARNILMFLLNPGSNPAIAQGRALDLALSGRDIPFNSVDWDIVGPDGSILASSVSTNGWDVETDHNDFHGIWVTTPGGASIAANYRARVSYGGSAFFDVTPSVTPPATAPVMLPLSLQNTIIVGGNNTTCTVALDAPAPTGGAVITLVCQSNGVTVPQSVIVPAGQYSVSFTITTQATTALYGAVIMASFDGIRETVLNVVPSGSSGPAVPINLTATGAPGQVTLNWTASTPNLRYNLKRSLTSGGPYTTIAHGLAATHYVGKNVVNNTTYYYVVTAYNGYGESANSNEASATPTVTVPVAGLSVNPASVIGGYLSIGTVTISTAAPQGGVPVTLSSSNTTAATTPTTITVPAGTVSADFLITTFPVPANTPVTLSATASGTTSTAPLTVLAASITAVTLTPNPVLGGSTATGIVTLNGDAPTGGAVATLASANAGVATLPVTSVTIAAGSRSATFTVNTTTVSSATAVAITATHGTGCNGSAATNLQVNPTNTSCYLADIALNPGCIVGAGTGTATVTLSAPAPAGGAVVTLYSNNMAVHIPASVTVTAGSQTAAFSIFDTGVALGEITDATYVTISGSYNSWSQAAILTALPAGYSLAVTNVTALGGNAGILLNWQGLPSGSIKGYNIYRLVNGTGVLLNAAPIMSTMYADTGLSNGSSYQYQVRLVDQTGTEGGGSTTVAASATASSTALTWRSTPTAPFTDTGTLYGSLSTGGAISYGYLLVDGASVQPLIPPDSNDLYQDGVQASFSTDVFTNGSHIFQMVGQAGGMAVVSPPLTVQINNDFGGASYRGVIEADTEDISWFNFTVPTDALST